MTEAVVTPVPEKENSERYKNLVIILTVLTTVLAAVLAALQSDASIRADIANRDSQFYAVQLSGELHRVGLVTNYDFNVFGNYLTDLQQATILELTALEQEQAGDTKAAQATRELAAIAQARADLGEKFTVFYTDPRYAPKEDGGMPDTDQYLTDLNDKMNAILAKQNEAADAYGKWNRKADSYVTALTILAVAFFLFGLAQAVKSARMRLTFTGFGFVVILITLLVTFFTLVG
ncbi:MAG: hypothetical protein QM730_00605 [Anaerolineales bacterium]